MKNNHTIFKLSSRETVNWGKNKFTLGKRKQRKVKSKMKIIFKFLMERKTPFLRNYLFIHLSFIKYVHWILWTFGSESDMHSVLKDPLDW